jgi:hypothetical protein
VDRIDAREHHGELTRPVQPLVDAVGPEMAQVE